MLQSFIDREIGHIYQFEKTIDPEEQDQLDWTNAMNLR